MSNQSNITEDRRYRPDAAGIAEMTPDQMMSRYRLVAVRNSKRSGDRLTDGDIAIVVLTLLCFVSFVGLGLLAAVIAAVR